MGYWKRHPQKDLEEVLKNFHEMGWRIIDPPTYYQVLCPCGQHYRWIHLTPSNPYYGNQALRWARRVCDQGRGVGR
jgi:hypothetical protein